ncbi:hypothetical protein DVH05_022544 [Phytophthora capsici]|nr:hypothetical protein DVH05_022544 [Phytophthora capsici]|eukprot:jgi/Phyca11/504542/fgenesh2_kg.PHYCAscaffold_8_\
MRAALENCGEFLCRIGALEGADTIAEILRKSGWELSETSSFRWRALVTAIRLELDADAADFTFLFERLLHLYAMKPSEPSRALFGSKLFLHILVKRFAVAFEGLDEELFKLESDELCHAEDIYDTCLSIQEKLEEDNTESELKKFLGAFKMIFEMDEPKQCWDAFFDLYRLNDASFRRDMKRALSAIESATLGPTKLELDSQTEQVEGPNFNIPRALLEKRFGWTRREWRDLSQINSISGADTVQEEEQENQQQELQEPNDSAAAEEPVASPGAQDSVNNDETESIASDISEDRAIERPAPARPPRAAEAARADRQAVRHAVPRRRTAAVHVAGSMVERQGGRRPRTRWSAEEEAALIEGYELYKAHSSVWMLIKTNYQDVLHRRSNVDLKDKYRNLVRYGRIPRANGDGTDTGATDNDGTDDNAEEIV